MKTLTILLLIPCFANAQTYFLTWSSGDMGTAINSALAANSTVVVDHTHIYQTSKTLNLPSGHSLISDADTTTIQPIGALAGSSSSILKVTGSSTTHSASSLSISCVKGSHTFTYSNASKIHVNDVVDLYGGVYNSTDNYSYGWRSLVTGVSGTTVTLSGACPETFTASSIKAMHCASSVLLQGIHFDGRTMTGHLADLDPVINSSVQACVFEGPYSTVGPSVLLSTKGYNILCDGNHYRNVKPLGANTTGTAYGHNMEGDSIVDRNSIYWNCQTGSTSAGRSFISTRIHYTSNNYSGEGTGHDCDLHGNAIGEIAFCTITSDHDAISIRHSGSSVHDNNITMNGSFTTMRAIWGFENLTACSIYNNYVVFTGSGAGYFFTNSGAQQNPSDGMLIYNNQTNGSINFVTSKTTTGNLVFDNTFFTLNGFNPKVSPASVLGTGNTFNGSSTPPTPPPVEPPPPPEPPCTDCSYEYNILWK